LFFSAPPVLKLAKRSLALHSPAGHEFQVSDWSGMGAPLKNKIMLESLDRFFSFQVSEFQLFGSSLRLLRFLM